MRYTTNSLLIIALYFLCVFVRNIFHEKQLRNKGAKWSQNCISCFSIVVVQTNRTIPISPQTNMESLLQALESLEEKMESAVKKQIHFIDKLHPSQKISASNLIRYLALRSEDLRSLQNALHMSGLSSLTNSESHILRQLQSILERLGKQIEEHDLSECDYYKGRELIQQRSLQLFGSKQDAGIPYIMVTFDTGFIGKSKFVKKLLESGMNIARINCAHDDKDAWEEMIFLIRASSEKTGIPCKIFMDLAGTKIRTLILGKGRKKGKVRISEEQEILLAEKDAAFDSSQVVIGCSEPGIVKQLKPGKRVLFDDGLVEAWVVSNANGIAVLKITRISGKKPRLKSKKGINFPETELSPPALTKQDQTNLPFICEHADLLGYSFVRHAGGIRELQTQLEAFQKKPQIILKIETPQAVSNFPSLLIQGMQDEVFGVMIARGDLAVEIGFEKLSEIQEEILWFSEAAHVPVIWATQVLETLNKTGIATRAEVTDASYAGMAECVMVNKGNHVIAVVKTLRYILQRSGAHHLKKRYTFPPMPVAINYFT